MSEVIIDVKRLEKQYMKQKAVHEVSFQIREGMICGLIGPNVLRYEQKTGSLFRYL